DVVARRVANVVNLVAGCSHDGDALAHGEVHGTSLSLVDRALAWVVEAVVEPGVGEVRVVGDIHVVIAGPHEGANNSFGPEVPVRVACLDARDAHLGRDAQHSTLHPAGGDGPGGVCAVTVIVHPR